MMTIRKQKKKWNKANRNRVTNTGQFGSKRRILFESLEKRRLLSATPFPSHVLAQQGEAYDFSPLDFRYTTNSNDSLESVFLTDVNLGLGTLELSGNPVGENQTILASELNDLVYTPGPVSDGDSAPSFLFSVNDPRIEAADALMRIRIEAANGVPINNDPNHMLPPEFQNVELGGTLTFSQMDGNAISVVDEDLGADGLLVGSVIPSVPKVIVSINDGYLPDDTAELNPGANGLAAISDYGVKNSSFSVRGGFLSHGDLNRTREKIYDVAYNQLVTLRNRSRDTTDLLIVDIEGDVGPQNWDEAAGTGNPELTADLQDLFDHYKLRLDVLREIFPSAVLVPYGTPLQVWNDNVETINRRAEIVTLAIQEGVFRSADAIAPRIYQGWGPGDISWAPGNDGRSRVETNVSNTIRAAANAISQAGDAGEHLQVVPMNSWQIFNAVATSGNASSSNYSFFEEVPEGYLRQLLEINQFVGEARGNITEAVASGISGDRSDEIVASIPAVITWQSTIAIVPTNEEPNPQGVDFNDFFEQGYQEVVEGSPVVSFSDAAIARGIGILDVTLDPENGSISLPVLSTAKFVEATQQTDGKWQLVGTPEGINQALSELVFTPDDGYDGPASISISTNDFSGTANGPDNIVESNVDIWVGNPIVALVDTHFDVVDESDGLTSLREALALANDNGVGLDRIGFAESLSGKTITLGDADGDGDVDELQIESDLEIIGLGADQLTISGADQTRVFNISSGVEVVLSGLRIADGNTTGSGGGLLSQGASLTVIDSTFDNNTASGSGGGVFFSNNSAASPALLTISGSTFSRNHSGGRGSGLSLQSFATTPSLPPHTIKNTTVSNNTGHSGGAVYLNGSDSLFVDIENATIAENHTNTATHGSGLWIVSTLGSETKVFNSVLAGNTRGSAYDKVDIFNGKSGSAPESGTLIGSHNLYVRARGYVGDFTHSANMNLDVVAFEDAGLLPLDNYGGPTETRALAIGSPAIDKGSNNYGGTTDQRRQDRTQSIDGNTTDIGAVEVDAVLVDTHFDVVDESDDFTSLREALALANDNGVGLDRIGFAESLSGKTITLGDADGDGDVDELQIESDLEIIGLGADQLTISGADQTRVFNISSGVEVVLSGLRIADGNTTGSGGGLLSQGASLTVIDSTFDNNTASGSGGGVFFSNNSAASPALLTISGSTFSRNHSGGRGSGLSLQSFATTPSLPPHTIKNTTVSNNTGHSGGAVYLNGSDSLFVDIENATIAENHTNTATHGSGLWIVSTLGSETKVFNSVLAGNTRGSAYDKVDIFNGKSGSAPESGTLIGSHNLYVRARGYVGDFTHSANMNLDVVAFEDAGLLPLDNYGGPTETRALAIGSPAIDKGSNNYGGTTDQRRQDRTQSIDGNTTDIGAVEAISPVFVSEESLLVLKGGSVPVANSNLTASDDYSSSDELFYELEDLPINGTLLLRGVELTVGNVFTQFDVDQGALDYEHDGTETLSDSVLFLLTDIHGHRTSAVLSIEIANE